MKTKIYAATKCSKCGDLHYSLEQKVILTVKCAICGKLHEQEGAGYVAVAGNITIGVSEGIVGNNIENDIVIKVSIFCVGECFESICKDLLSLKKIHENSLYCMAKNKDESNRGIDDWNSCPKKKSCLITNPKTYDTCKGII